MKIFLIMSLIAFGLSTSGFAAAANCERKIILLRN